MEQVSLKSLLLDLLNFHQTAQDTFIAELSKTERTAIGTWAHWSARDHVAHLTFWKQEDCLQLAARVRRQLPPISGALDLRNQQVFEEQRERSWEAILFDAKRIQADLLAWVERLSEDELTRPSGFAPAEEDPLLWAFFLDHGFSHPLEHLTQFSLERHEVLRATQIQHAWADKASQPEVPMAIRTIGLA